MLVGQTAGLTKKAEHNIIDNNARVKEILKEKNLQMDSIDNMYLFRDRCKEKLSKVVTAKQKSKSLFTGLHRQKKKIRSNGMDSPCSRTLCHNTDKLVEGEDSSLQEQLTEEEDTFTRYVPLLNTS